MFRNKNGWRGEKVSIPQVRQQYTMVSMMEDMVFRFNKVELRQEVWSRRQVAKKNNLYMEEWLTGKIIL